MCAVISVFIKFIQAKLGSTAKLNCPYQADSGEIRWIKPYGNIKETYSDGQDINKDLSPDLKERLTVKGRDLCISNVKKSDEGIYECLLLKPDEVPQGSQLKLVVVSA
ncbi:Hypothetical predicted protein, partial [Mytilus galloprovincialis]